MLKFTLILGLFGFVSGADGQGPEIDSDHFGALIKTLQGNFEDVSFVYEGESQFVGSPSILIGTRKDKLDARFQYVYAYRSDGATVLEGFYRLFDPESTYKYQRTSFLNNQMETVNFCPDRLGLANQIQSAPGDLNSLYSRNIPSFFFMWFFKTIRSYQEHGYQYLGWEQLEGHRCLHVKIGRAPLLSNPKTSYFQLWIDVERDGHPLKIELFDGDGLMERLDKVQLKKFAIRNDKFVWMPVYSELTSFNWTGSYYNTPIIHEKSWVVDGSLSLNSSLSDSIFSVRSKSRLPETPYLRRYYEQFTEASKKNVLKTDPKSVRERLDKQLAMADEQAKELQASKPADLASNFNLLVQLVVALAAIACALVALVIRYRRS